MARIVTFDNSRKSYATRANAIKAVEKLLGQSTTDCRSQDGLDYFVYTTADGRFVPVFVGERAVHRGIHFNFHIVD